jgi:hypothetical protein
MRKIAEEKQMDGGKRLNETKKQTRVCRRRNLR